MKYLTIIILLIATTAYSQEYGLSVGANYTFIENHTGKPGIDIMAVISTPSGDKLDYQFELGYSMTQPDSKFEYLKIAFIPKYFIVGGLNIQAGPRIGYLLNASEGENNPKTSAHLAAMGGIGYKFNQIDLSLRYNHGISQLREDVRDRSIQLTAGIFF